MNNGYDPNDPDNDQSDIMLGRLVLVAIIVFVVTSCWVFYG